MNHVSKKTEMAEFLLYFLWYNPVKLNIYQWLSFKVGRCLRKLVALYVRVAFRSLYTCARAPGKSLQRVPCFFSPKSKRKRKPIGMQVNGLLPTQATINFNTKYYNVKHFNVYQIWRFTKIFVLSKYRMIPINIIAEYELFVCCIIRKMFP